MRFPVEIVKNIRLKTGNSFPIIFRMSGEEWCRTAGPWRNPARSQKTWRNAGVNAISVSVGVYATMAYIIPPAALPVGFNLSAASRIRKSVSIPVMAAGRINDPVLAGKRHPHGQGGHGCAGKGIYC
jgi:2,4-dienoyl-CoA reductase-like NADH-dependent reductase (Old Yellow Enzyme family)